MVGIYKITNNINNKIYIGQSIHIKRRWTEHCQPSSNSLISKAIRKYGKNNFTFEIIEKCPQNQLNERENYWIKYYDCINPNGYNISEGSDNKNNNYCFIDKAVVFNIINELFSEKSFKEIAKDNNVDISTISRINSGESHYQEDLKYPIRNTQIDKHVCIDCGTPIQSSATRCAICYAKSIRKVKDRPTVEELKQILLDNNGNFTKVGKLFGVTDNSIRKWCKNYDLPTHSSDYKPKKEKLPTKISVCQIDKNTNEVIQTFESAEAAARFLGKSKGNHITEVCRGTSITAYGYKWKYADK